MVLKCGICNKKAYVSHIYDGEKPYTLVKCECEEMKIFSHMYEVTICSLYRRYRIINWYENRQKNIWGGL